jgi:transposase-like protein
MDGLEGLPDAVQAVFPKTLTQLCIVHLARASLRYVTAGGRT